MNECIFKRIAIFVMGAAVGAITAVQVVKNKYATMAQEDIDDFREYYRQRVIEEKESLDDTIDHLIDSQHTSKTGIIFRKEDQDKAELEAYEEESKKYNKVPLKKDIEAVMRERGLSPFSERLEELTDDHREDGDFDEDDAEELLEAEWKSEMQAAFYTGDEQISIVTAEDFFDSPFDHYDKMTITYYDGDGTLADEREEIIPSPADILGIGTLDHFGLGSGDPNIVYVRNHKISTDFEVVRSHEGYVDAVLGMATPVVKKPKPKPQVKENASTSKPKRKTPSKKVVKDGAL